MMKSPSQELQRYPVRFPVGVRLEGAETAPLPGVVRRLGRDGLSLLLAVEGLDGIVPGRLLDLECPLPDHSRALELAVRVAALRSGVRDHRGGEAVELDATFEAGADGQAVAALLEAYGAKVLFYGFERGASRSLSAELGLGSDLITAETPEEALELLDRREVAVLCLGEEVTGSRAQEFLHQALTTYPLNDSHNVVLAAGTELELFQELINEDRLYYLSQKAPPLNDVRDILQSALKRYGVARPAGVEGSLEDSQRVLELARSLAMADRVEAAAERAAQAIEGLVDADRAWVLLYDPDQETLSSPARGDLPERCESAAAGLVSFVVRTGASIRLEAVGEDPRYDPEADSDGGAPEERFVAVPVPTPSAAAQHLGESVLAVIVALREASSPAFSAGDQARLTLLAEHLSPTLGRFALDRQLKAGAQSSLAAASQLFRQEALEHHVSGLGEEGHVLELSSGWIEWSYRLLLFVFAAALVFSVAGSIHEYARGPAVVQVDGRSDVTAALPGAVTSVEVEAGQAVRAGQLLVRFYEAQEVAELRRIDREFELGLVQRLRDPTDPGVERALGNLRAQRQLAQARLEERFTRAPHDGIVSDLRIRPGQYLQSGQVILSLIEPEPQLSIVAMLPGHYRPLVEPGMALRLELQGYRYQYQHLVVDEVGEEVVGPGEVRRVLGAGIGDAVALNGPMILVRARLPSMTFESDGEEYQYHDGIQGTAEVRVRSERILTSLLPGLKGLFR